jgi:hypothetical protein
MAACTKDALEAVARSQTAAYIFASWLYQMWKALSDNRSEAHAAARRPSRPDHTQ